MTRDDSSGGSDVELPTVPGAPRTAKASKAPPPPESASVVLAMRSTANAAHSVAFELRREEAQRARAFVASLVALAVLEVAGEIAASDSLLARLTMIVVMFGLAAAAADAWTRTRDPLRYTRHVARRVAAACVIAATAITWRLGPFSPAPMLTTLGIAFFGLGEDKRVAYTFTTLASLGYMVVAWLVSSGIAPDVGLVRIDAAVAAAQPALVLLVPAVHAATLWHARLSRRSTLEAIQRSHEWIREVRQREVQLEEANRDLDMLLKLGPGESAPYSGARAGDYVLHERIGRGAMGEVYAAKHAESGEMAAVKLLQPSMQENSVLMERFQREGDAAAKLRAPNVVQIYEIGAMEDGAPYLAMELLRGHDLAWHLRRRGQLSIDEVLSLVDHVAAGLEVARAAGVVHRDLKPQNLFLAQQMNASPAWKILDFGVSRLADSGGTLTKDVIVGTPGYMSPEQAAGTTASHRSDLFSFGAVLYRSLTGNPPFAAEDTPQTLYQVVYRNPMRPSALVPGLPPDVDLVLAIALAKDPADRFDSAREMAGAMAAAARSTLAAPLRLHARTILAALPWGTDNRENTGEIEDELSLRDAERIDLP